MTPERAFEIADEIGYPTQAWVRKDILSSLPAINKMAAEEQFTEAEVEAKFRESLQEILPEAKVIGNQPPPDPNGCGDVLLGHLVTLINAMGKAGMGAACPDTYRSLAILGNYIQRKYNFQSYWGSDLDDQQVEEAFHFIDLRNARKQKEFYAQILKQVPDEGMTRQ